MRAWGGTYFYYIISTRAKSSFARIAERRGMAAKPLMNNERG